MFRVRVPAAARLSVTISVADQIKKETHSVKYLTILSVAGLIFLVGSSSS